MPFFSIWLFLTGSCWLYIFMVFKLARILPSLCLYLWQCMKKKNPTHEMVEIVSDGGSIFLLVSVSHLNFAHLTALCCLAQLSAGCYRAEEQGLVQLEAGFKVGRLPALRSQRRQAPLRCGGRWPGFCGCYYRIGVGNSQTHNPSAVHLTADTCTPFSLHQQYAHIAFITGPNKASSLYISR